MLFFRAGSRAPGEVSTRRRSLRESLGVVLAFRHEQSDPDRFYRLLASDTATLVGQFCKIEGSRVLDLGSGPGDLAEAFRQRGAEAVALDSDFEEMHCRDRALRSAVVADGCRTPFAAGSFDVACSSNVLEHVAEPLAVVQEMSRITRPGGLVFVNYTAWLSPWGGHETAPWHYLGGERAVAHYERAHGKPPKNLYGTSLFALGVGSFLKQVRTLGGLELVDAFPRYLPRWSRPLLSVPGVREVATWNLAVALRRCP